MSRPTTPLNKWVLHHRKYYWGPEAQRKRRAAGEKAWAERNKVSVQRRSKEKRDEIRLKALDALGGRNCKRCGYNADPRALCIDHVNGGGNKETYEFGHNLYLRYWHIIQHAASGLYQVLCMNCNRIKQFENKEFGNGRPRKVRVGGAGQSEL